MLCSDLSGRKYKIKRLHVCAWLIHFAVQKKLTQNCKAAKLFKINQLKLFASSKHNFG